MANTRKIHEYFNCRVRLKSGLEGIVDDTGNDYKTYYGLVEKYDNDRLIDVLIKEIKAEDIEAIIPDIQPPSREVWLKKHPQNTY